MRIKKRYIILVLAIALFAVSRMEFLKLRMDDESQRAQLMEGGQKNITFRTYSAGDRIIHYTITGSDSLPLVIFVHGSPGSSSQMLDFLADSLLNQHARIAAVDRPGFGYSGFGRVEPSLEKQASALKYIAERHGNGKVILAGHSFGGPVIARMAMDFPELVDGLVIVAGALSPRLEPDYWWQKPLNWPVIRYTLPPAFRVSNQEILKLKDELEEMLPLWSNITCPVTVVHGMDDGLVNPANVKFASNMLVNSRRLVIDTIPNDGHLIMWTRKGRITEDIVHMLEMIK